MGKRIILGIGIAVIFTIVVFYGILTLYPKPKKDSHVTSGVTVEQIWGIGGIPEITEEEKATLRKEHKEQLTRYNEVRDRWSRNVFFICLPLGLIALIVGIRLKVQPVSGGLMGGGILTLIGGTGFYWGHLGELVRLIALGIVLIFLIWLGYKKIGVRVK